MVDAASPALAFGLSILVAGLIYLIGRALSHQGAQDEVELSPYACGEVMPPVRPRMEVSRFFTYVLLFLAFDIAIPIIALAVVGQYLQALIYLAIMLLAVLTPAAYLREVRRR